MDEMYQELEETTKDIDDSPKEPEYSETEYKTFDEYQAEKDERNFNLHDRIQQSVEAALDAKAKKKQDRKLKKKKKASSEKAAESQDKSEKKRMTSIARQINWDFWFRKLAAALIFDLLLFVAICIQFVVKCNKEIPDYAFTDSWGNLAFTSDTEVDILFPDDDDERFLYKVTLANGEIYEFNAGDFFKEKGQITIVIVIFQGIWLFMEMFNTRRIRRRMKPLYDVAIRAEAVSKMAAKSAEGEYMSENSMRHLESAINKANPNEPLIKTGDKELMGIEIALNNLLRDMQESKKQQIRFVSDASHELRTPIAVIQGYVNMLDRWGKEDEDVLTESIEALKNESEHMKELVEQLLFLARGDSGRNNLQRKDFDLAETMYEVWEESSMIDEEHKYSFYVDDKPVTDDEQMTSEHMVNGDLAMIKQSARIFIQNAAKYSEKGTEIVLKVGRSGDGKIYYVIQDEGVGLNQNQLNHIFERFYRSDEARNSEVGGTGLGLSIAKWIIDAHEGRVEVLSRKEIGTRFTVAFDALDSKKEQSA
ncbi:Signal transduction histidine kinase [Eubacterium ruminantium]|nr:Signal transduction histidine kinase [Eubacterium ruminantium]